MQTLNDSLRTQLESSICKAREVSEQGALKSLQHLGVANPSPSSLLNEDEKQLHSRLRAHGRQLGDQRSAKDEVQELDLLIEEIAYQHWHRMLFARFLAENNLLMYPDAESPVPITLSECEDLASELGLNNGWEVASNFATKLLPQVFRQDSPVLDLEFSPEYQLKLEELLIGLSNEIFACSDSLGWVYQYWQSRKKSEIKELDPKIGKRELPAVTQLFTEPFMVNFILDNTIGAWWVEKTVKKT